MRRGLGRGLRHALTSGLHFPAYTEGGNPLLSFGLRLGQTLPPQARAHTGRQDRWAEHAGAGLALTLDFSYIQSTDSRPEEGSG